MNAKMFLMFGAGLAVGAGGVGGFAIYKARKANKAYEDQICEVKAFYKDRFDDAVKDATNEIVKQKIFNGELVYSKTSLDDPSIVTEEIKNEGEDDSQNGPNGPDPPSAIVRNFFDDHEKTMAATSKKKDDPNSGNRDESRPVHDKKTQAYGFSEASLAMQKEISLAESRPNYVKYSSYSRAAQKRDTAKELAEYQAEQDQYNESLEIESQYNEEGNLVDENGMGDPVAEQHLTEELAPTEQSPIPFMISQDEFENQYPLYEKETLFYYMIDNVLAFDNMEAIDDPAMYVGTIAPITLFPTHNGGIDSGPVYIRNHRLGMDLCVYCSGRSYQAELEAGGY